MIYDNISVWPYTTGPSSGGSSHTLENLSNLLIMFTKGDLGGFVWEAPGCKDGRLPKGFTRGVSAVGRKAGLEYWQNPIHPTQTR